MGVNMSLFWVQDVFGTQLVIFPEQARGHPRPRGIPKSPHKIPTYYEYLLWGFYCRNINRI